MCIVSNVGDMGSGLIPPWPWPQPFPSPFPGGQPVPFSEEAAEEFKLILKSAKKYDVDTGQPDCEDPEKTKVVAKVEEAAAAAGPMSDELQREFVRDLAGLRALIDAQCSVPLLLGAMRTIVERYGPAAP
jgi:hypothetical protein